MLPQLLTAQWVSRFVPQRDRWIAVLLENYLSDCFDLQVRSYWGVAYAPMDAVRHSDRDA